MANLRSSANISYQDRSYLATLRETIREMEELLEVTRRMHGILKNLIWQEFTEGRCSYMDAGKLILRKVTRHAKLLQGMAEKIKATKKMASDYTKQLQRQQRESVAATNNDAL